MPFHESDHKVQVMLAYLGYSVGTLDGIWGRNTANALINFQANYGLSQTGKYDQTTLNTLHSEFMNGNYVVGGAVLQSLLHYAGYDPGTIDGIAGRRTLRALNEFLTDYDYYEVDSADDLDTDAISSLKGCLYGAA